MTPETMPRELRAVREATGLTRERLAVEAGLSSSTIRNVKRGLVPSESTVTLIMAALVRLSDRNTAEVAVVECES